MYLYHNGFIYYLQEGGDMILPLCNKADCLHDQETNLERIKECNASVDSYAEGLVWQDNVGIAKCGDFIYCMGPPLFTIQKKRS